MMEEVTYLDTFMEVLRSPQYWAIVIGFIVLLRVMVFAEIREMSRKEPEPVAGRLRLAAFVQGAGMFFLQSVFSAVIGALTLIGLRQFFGIVLY